MYVYDKAEGWIDIMGPYSAYDVAESGPAKWRPGEELAASGFVAIVFYLVIDINLCIYRIFHRKRGLYYWCMLLGTLGCLIDNIAVVLRFFRPFPASEPLWPLYTLFILAGWTVYAPAQLLILYSRLHLVNRDRRVQRGVLAGIITVAALMIIPTWPLVWRAYNPYDERGSALYSPREAIVDRVTQIGYTLAESVIGGIYVVSLARILRLKGSSNSVRQRRVMTDLIYVNVFAVACDVLTVVLVYLNQTGVSHPVQTFSYALKLKLEFSVLNQLMAVAARGVKRESFAERRYHHRPEQDGSSSLDNEKDESSSSAVVSSSNQTSRWGMGSLDRASAKKKDDGSPSRELVVPSPTLSRVHRGSVRNGSVPRGVRDGGGGEGRWPMKAKVKRHAAGGGRGHAEEDEDEDEIGIHMWENHGKLVMEVPWFVTEGRA